MENCNYKTRFRNESEKKQILDRLNRMNGQISGIKQMVEDSRYCDDILTQIASVNSSLKSLGLLLIDNHMRTCIKDTFKEDEEAAIEELISIFKRFYKWKLQK